MQRSPATGAGRALRATIGLALALFLSGTQASRADSFDRSPRDYGALADQALARVGSGLRFRLLACSGQAPTTCRFAARRVTARVVGDVAPPRIRTVVIESDLLTDRPGADPSAMVADAVSAFGATMIALDPRLPSDRRAAMLNDLTATALETGTSDGRGVEAEYSLSFDRNGDGRLSIAVTPAREAPPSDDFAGLTYRKVRPSNLP